LFETVLVGGDHLVTPDDFRVETVTVQGEALADCVAFGDWFGSETVHRNLIFRSETLKDFVDVLEDF
jgi:hypothetical protein